MFGYMEQEELEISEIVNLELVDFYHLERDGGSVPAIMVYYNGGKTINYCVFDRFYNKLLNRVFEVYELEKDNEDLFLSEYSKQVLNRVVEDRSYLYNELLGDYKAVKDPFINSNGYLSIPTVGATKFMLEKLFELGETKLLWNPIDKIWFDQGILEASSRDAKYVFACQLTNSSTGEYKLCTNEHVVNIKYGMQGVDIKLTDTKDDISLRLLYEIQDKCLVCTSVTRDGNRDRGINKNTIDGSFQDGKHIYELPWGVKIELSQVEKEASIDKKVTYIFTNQFSQLKLTYCFNEMRGDSGPEFGCGYYAVEEIKSIVGNQYNQLHFCDMGYETDGYYKQNLIDKYYVKNRKDN